ncbi:MAG: hypothetical protein KJO95_13090 [Gammaproteobacteria bacterium]|nr:hypothetical protein [Gammaproteobacteria bacterium]
MRISLRLAVLALGIISAGVAQAQQSEIEQLRSAVEAMRSDYEARITELERRLAVAEQNALQANYAARQADSTSQPAPPQESELGGRQESLAFAPATGSRSAAFNPAVGVIFQGTAWNFNKDPDDYAIQGFPLGGEAGPIDEGLALGETELIFNANVDDKFTGWLTAALALEDGEAIVEIEEAWVEATALPAGFGARFGRFFSGVGYLNARHRHTWDFADQPLPYKTFLGGQYLDDGVQLRWLAPTDLYMEFGGEWLRGDRYPTAGAAKSGAGTYSLFAKFGGDLGTDSSWLAGLSYLDGTAVDRPSGDEDDPLLFNGDSTLTAAEFVWKWAPNGNWKQKNLIIQAEYFWRDDSGDYVLPGGGSPLAYDADQTGWYAQAVYQPMPRWRVGGRFDGLATDNPGSLFDGTELAAPGSDPRRYTIMTDWSNSEFSRLRLQFTRDESGPSDDTQWGLQYIHSIGAHGAHTF